MFSRIIPEQLEPNARATWRQRFCVGLPALIVVFAFGVTSATAQTQQLPAALLHAVDATARAKVPFAFDLDLSTAEQRLSAHFAPAAAPRLRLVSPARTMLDRDMQNTFDRLAEHLDGVTWCAGPNITSIADVRLLREDETTATYSFQPTRDSVTSDQTRAIVDHLRGELTLTKGSADISSIRIFAPQAFSPAPLATIERYTITTACALAPNGRQYAVETVSEARGSALGRTFAVRSVRRIHNLSVAP